ncbi:hypothetical protein Ae201684P_002753 [Aphanomyces euteiches]|uniref:WRKY transcription factor 19 n=1 Tax=Aphanomyces euteiches TaxID=100861 RepID=A0A6G0X5G4_9STRA|nr:hypothetical protein Ae201684_008339 [Aphanomyces euteiches]KAH9070394.1 hypothetical protein Ae201684P_002753 [Aphanomyces euteiches]KAH9157418.1 hypothetical protein AeRB84_000722 [Aphanomyces euteiches]
MMELEHDQHAASPSFETSPSSSSSSAMDTCHFNGCKEKVRPGTRKCAFHRKKGICSIQDCRNQVYARSLCVRHGARKPCVHPGCEGFARYGGYCCKHGDKYNVKGCSEEGCLNKAHARQKCVRHGGGRKCREDGCDAHARNGGLCSKHSGSSSPEPLALRQSVSTTPGRPSMTDICMVLSRSYGLPAPMNLCMNPQSSAKLPSIKLSYEYKPYFVVNA